MEDWTRHVPVVAAVVTVALSASATQHSPPSPVTASSVYDQRYLPNYAVDGNPKTRWASRGANARGEWLLIDFGKSVPIEHISINWERAYAVDYDLQTADDGKTWQTVARKRGCTLGVHTFDQLEAQGRFLRVFCTRHGQFGLYSIWELNFGAASAADRALAEQQETVAATRRRAAAALEGQFRNICRKSGIEKLIFAIRENGRDGHWYANFGYYAQDENSMCYGVQGRLCVLDVRTKQLTTLINDPTGTIRDPAVHYDGKRILFSWRKGGTRVFHLYEIDVEGANLRQLTHSDYDDIEPTYLPDGGVMFISSRCKRWVNCWLTQVGVLYRCDANGQNVRRISANVEHDNTPWVLPDGRVLYQRWEYVDRSQVHYHHLWTTNPDGSGQMAYFGNMHPGSVFIDAKPIPGTRDVLLIDSPGHGRREHSGFMATVSQRQGPDERQQLQRFTGENYRDPYPLTESLFLAALGRQLMLVDRNGMAHPFYTLPEGAFSSAALHEPRPIMARARECVVANRVDEHKTTGRLILADVYQGRNMDGVKRGEIKQLLVLESLPKPINYTGGMEPMSYGGTFTLARIVGTVPVEDDGSAHMELPADRAFYLVALDAEERSVKRMQSFLTVMPGETTGCVGCHEPRTEAPPNRAPRGRLQAAERPPTKPVPVPGVPDVFEFARDIQPVLERHCVCCHRPEKRSGGVLLTGDRGPMFSHSYFALSAHCQISDGRNRPRSNYAPRTIGDCASPLVTKLTGGHHDLAAPASDLRLVRYWINAGAAWLGTYAGLGTGMIGGYAQNKIDRRDTQWPSVKAAQDVLQRRCTSCHNGDLVLPSSPSDNQGMPPWAVRYGDPRLRLSRHILYNLSTPEKSGLLLAPLAPKAGGWGMPRKDKDGKTTEVHAVFADTSDPDYATLLESVRHTKRELERSKRFDMPGFKPRPEYIREMKRYGVIAPGFELQKDDIDVYDTDQRYWQSQWYRPKEP